LLSSCAGENVELRSAGVFRVPPLGIEPAGAFQTLHGGKKRSRVNLEYTSCNLLNASTNAETVHRFKTQGFQDQEVECALDQVGVLLSHVSSLVSRHLDCQDVTVNGYKPRDSPLLLNSPPDEQQIANALIEESIGIETSAGILK
jgi:hypothetical protein